MVLKDGAFGRKLGSDEVLRVELHDGISALLRVRGELTLSVLHHMTMQLEVSNLEPGRGLLPEPDCAGTLIVEFPVSRSVRNTFLLLINYPVHSIFL